MRRLREEQGFALTPALLYLALMITLSGVALQQVVTSLRQTSHQTDVKKALQAADAGLQSAMFAAQRIDVAATIKIDPTNPSLVSVQNCVATAGTVGSIDISQLSAATPVDLNGKQWCPENTNDNSVVDNATYGYRLSQLARIGAGPCGTGSLLNLNREVVGVGRSNGVVRRVYAKLSANLPLLSGAAVQSGSTTSPMTMADTAKILGDAESNNAIKATGVNVISGNATSGYGFTTTGVVAGVSTASACQNFAIPEVDQGTAPTVNDNATKITGGCVDPLLGLIPVICTPLTGGVVYDPSTRTLTVTGNGRAVLTGAKYSFCSIRLSGSGMLEISPSTSVTRIFLDDPNNCRTVTNALIPNAGQITMDGAARIVNCHAQTQPQTLQLYAVGSTTLPTTQTLAGANLLTGTLRSTLCGVNIPVVGDPMVIVAPHSTMELGGSTVIAGTVAADVVHMAGLSSVNPINALVNINQLGARPLLPLYKPLNYTECTAQDFPSLPVADPAQGC